MSRKSVCGALAIALLVGPLAGCEGSDEERALPAMLKARIQTEMRTILRDLQTAQEQASVIENRYLELAEVRGRYFTRPVGESYELVVTDVSVAGYRAQVTHKASGLSCRLEVGESVRGTQECD